MLENFALLLPTVTGSTKSRTLVYSLVVVGNALTLDRMRRFLERNGSWVG